MKKTTLQRIKIAIIAVAVSGIVSLSACTANIRRTSKPTNCTYVS